MNIVNEIFGSSTDFGWSQIGHIKSITNVRIITKWENRIELEKEAERTRKRECRGSVEGKERCLNGCWLKHSMYNVHNRYVCVFEH